MTEIMMQRPEYELSVKSAIFAFIEKLSPSGDPEYEKKGETQNPLIRRMDIIKTIGIAPNVSESKIHASGLVYDVTTLTTGATISLDAVALPRDVVDKAIGAVSKGGVSYDLGAQVGKEFSFGYFCGMSDKSQVFYFHPRCKLLLSDEQHKTAGGGEIDPTAAYKVEIMPTDEGVWRVRYYTKDHAVGKKPLTIEDFYKALPYKIATIEGLPALEKE